MKKVTLPNGKEISYGYDALNRRISRTVDGVTTQFLHDGWNVVADIGSDGSRVDYLNGLNVDEKLRQTSTATGPLYFIHDHLNSTIALTRTDGSVAERIQYDAFGNSPGSTLTRFTYTGRERDNDTGLMYYRARWYDPSQGRFINEDPIKFRGGLNFYSYVNNDPINRIDPYGLIDARLLCIWAVQGIGILGGAQLGSGISIVTTGGLTIPVGAIGGGIAGGIAFTPLAEKLCGKPRCDLPPTITAKTEDPSNIIPFPPPPLPGMETCIRRPSLPGQCTYYCPKSGRTITIPLYPHFGGKCPQWLQDYLPSQ